jgi:hypothetical protein
MVELRMDVVRSTATRVELDVWLQDAESGDGLRNHPVTLIYDGKSEDLKTDNTGHVLAHRPRLNRKVIAEASWQANYSAGALWIAEDVNQPPLIQAEPLEIKLRIASTIDPDKLKSGTDLMYQEIGDFLEKHTPLGPQPAARIGLVALGAGWIILLVQIVVQMRRRE